MEALATQHYNLVIAVGFLMDRAVKQVAKAFPNTKFAIVDDAPTPTALECRGPALQGAGVRLPAPAIWPA